MPEIRNLMQDVRKYRDAGTGQWVEVVPGETVEADASVADGVVFELVRPRIAPPKEDPVVEPTDEKPKKASRRDKA